MKVDNFDEEVIVKENDGTSEYSIQILFVDRSIMIDKFNDDACIFEERKKDRKLTRYGGIL